MIPKRKNVSKAARSRTKRGKAGKFSVHSVEESTKTTSDTEDEKFENVKEHKAQLAALAQEDPEFFKFLQEQDADLLQFDESDISSSEGSLEEASHSNADENLKNRGIQKKIKFPHDKDGRRIVDRKLIEYLEESISLKGRPSPSAVRLAVNSFVACVARVGANIDSLEFVINDEQVFEDVIRLCFQHLSKALFLLLDPVDEKTKKTEKLKGITDVEASETVPRFRKWKKYSFLIKKYLESVLLFLNELHSPEVTAATLRALSQLTSLFVLFRKLSKSFIKAVVRVWSRRNEECKCLAFIVLCKIVRVNKRLYTTVLKSCYVAYVSNTRVITAETWILVIFMQRSFAEICALHPNIAYHYVFVYIRQMAIHVRNAMIAKRKDLLQTVYNWQFIMCLFLWAHVIGKAYRIKNVNKQAEWIVELEYPLVQITISTMKLFPSKKYFPLRLLCLRVLLMIQVNCKTFIPSLPLAIELLDEASVLIKKKPKKGKGSVKTADINCLLKISNPQLEEAGFRQSALEALFRIQLEAAYILRNHCSFPDIMVPLEGVIKNFIKKCKNTEHARLFNSLNSKLNEQAKYVASIVANSELELNDQSSIKAVNGLISSDESPLSQFYFSWQNVWKLKNNVGVKDGTLTKSKKGETNEVSSEVSKRNGKFKKAKILDGDHVMNAGIGANTISAKKVAVGPRIALENSNAVLMEVDDKLSDLILSDSD